MIALPQTAGHQQPLLAISIYCGPPAREMTPRALAVQQVFVEDRAEVGRQDPRFREGVAPGDRIGDGPARTGCRTTPRLSWRTGRNGRRPRRRGARDDR